MLLRYDMARKVFVFLGRKAMRVRRKKMIKLKNAILFVM